MASTRQRAAPARLAGFDRAFSRAMRSWNVPGAAVGVVRDGRVIHAKGYGVMDTRRGTPVTAETLFNICSCSKAFTATSIAMLVDKGKLDWDTPVREYLPSFRLMDPVAGEQATLRDLLSHRTGLPRHDRLKESSPLPRAELVRRLAYLEPGAGFRSRFQYNNLMYIAAGYILEQVAGVTWEQFTHERIFRPLGMTASRFGNVALPGDTDPAPWRKLHVGYEKRGKRLVNWLRTFREPVDLAEGMGIPCGPNGSIYSNVPDMCRWLQFQLAGGKVARRRLLSKKALAETHTPVIPAPYWPVIWPELPDACYALGWVVRSFRGMRWIFHPGGGRGFNAYASFLPNEGIGVVVLVNSPAPLTWTATLNLFERLLGLERIHWDARARRYRARQQAEMDGRLVPLRPKSGKRPSHRLAEYAGTYRHPGYGPLVVSAGKGGLIFRFNRFTLRFRHVHYDVFQMTRRIGDGGVPRTRAAFGMNDAGEIESVSIPLVDDAPEIDIIFRRTETGKA